MSSYSASAASLNFAAKSTYFTDKMARVREFYLVAAHPLESFLCASTCWDLTDSFE